MKKNLFGPILAALLALTFTSSCGINGYYSSSEYDDGIYYRPDRNSRVRMVSDKAHNRELEPVNEYLAEDEKGNLYVVSEYLNGETYESRLRKFDSPTYSFSVNFGIWGSPWYNPWWGNWVYPYGPYYASTYWCWRWGWWDPWFDPVWGWPYYSPGFYPYGPYYYHPYVPYRPYIPVVVNTRPNVYTSRTATYGGGAYRENASGARNSGVYRNISGSGGTNYSVGSYTRRNSSTTISGNNGSPQQTRYRRTTVDNVRNSRGNTNYSPRNNNVNMAPSPTQSSGGFSGGSGYSGGGGFSGGGGYSGGNMGGAGTHSGGGRR